MYTIYGNNADLCAEQGSSVHISDLTAGFNMVAITFQAHQDEPVVGSPPTQDLRVREEWYKEAPRFAASIIPGPPPPVPPPTGSSVRRTGTVAPDRDELLRLRTTPPFFDLSHRGSPYPHRRASSFLERFLV